MGRDAERPGKRSHAERGNERKLEKPMSTKCFDKRNMAETMIKARSSHTSLYKPEKQR